MGTTDESSYTDAATGGVYELNPNWRVVSGGATQPATQLRELPNDTTEARSAFTTNGTDTDWSGRVQTQVVECSSGLATGSISVACSVSADFVLIGGGAEDAWNEPGALLWESHPQDVDDSGAGTTWVASSKDHLSPASHRLNVWAVGLKLKRSDGTFLTRGELKSHISYSRVTSSQDNHPSALCTVPTGKVAIGGGVRANWQVTGGVGQLLTHSAPAGPTDWFGATKDHLTADAATLDVSCIGIDPAIAGFGSLVVDEQIVGGPVSGGIGLFAGGVSASPRSVLACYGAEAGWDGAGRMLFRMSPGYVFQSPQLGLREVVAGSKDHLQADSGTTNSWISTVRLQ